MFANRIRRPFVVGSALIVAVYASGCPGGGTPGEPAQPENPEVTRALREGFTRGLGLAQANPSSSNDGVCGAQNFDYDLASISAPPEVLAEIPTVRYAGCRVGHASYVMGWRLKAEGRRDSRYCTTYARERIAPIVRFYAERAITAEETTLVVNACRQGYTEGRRSTDEE
jgi:hypothetical protein